MIGAVDPSDAAPLRQDDCEPGVISAHAEVLRSRCQCCRVWIGSWNLVCGVSLCLGAYVGSSDFPSMDPKKLRRLLERLGTSPLETVREAMRDWCVPDVPH